VETFNGIRNLTGHREPHNQATLACAAPGAGQHRELCTERIMSMPTILLIFGWRLFFYANEGNEPIHVHCRKGEKECKYWLDTETFDLEEAYGFNMTPRDKRDTKKIIFEHFEYIEQQWEEFQRRREL